MKQKSKASTGLLKPDKNQSKRAPKENYRDFCLMFMNRKKDGERNPGSRSSNLKDREFHLRSQLTAFCSNRPEPTILVSPIR